MNLNPVPKAVCSALLAIILFFGFNASAQGFLKASGKQIVNDRNENVLLRGIGLGGWMLQEGYMLNINGGGQQHKIREKITALIGAEKTEAFYSAWLENHTRKIDIDSLKSWGFNSVRLPMHYNLYTLPIEKEPVKGKDTWLERGFAMTDSLLEWCKANKMYLILDLHAAPGGQGNDFNISDRDPELASLWDSEENQRKTVSLWRKLAERYKNEPWIGGYDIINEPNYGFADPQNDKNGIKEKGNAPLRKLMIDITAAIRTVDKNHMVIIEGNGWGNNYNGIFPVWDKNLVVSYHKYWNYNDPESIKGMLATRDTYNVPLWLGETGENSNVWYTDAIRLLEANNIGWAWWPLKKLGGNNPLQIPLVEGYNKILTYWSSDKNPKPSEDEAFRILMDYASALKFENNIVKRDVIDAMMRQPGSNATRSYKTHVLQDHLLVEAEDYDLGHSGYAYFDTDSANYRVSTGKATAGNKGGAYRNDGVDISFAKEGRQPGFYISDIAPGEWLQYTLEVPETGIYAFTLTVAAWAAPADMRLLINGEVAGVVRIPVTGGQEQWSGVYINNVKIQGGMQKIRLQTGTGGFNLDKLEIKRVQ